MIRTGDEAPARHLLSRALVMDIGRRSKYFRLQVALLFLFSVISIGRIIFTYFVFNQTWDEPVHVASGMEWLQQGTYTYEDLHPPLARVAVAIGPYLSGIRLSSRDLRPAALVDGGNAVFAAHGNYLQTLALARLGVLPFFLIGLWAVWYWTCSLYDGWTAVAAAGLFTMLPPVLGHAGLATTDMAITAALVLSICAFTSWLDRPTAKRAILLGIVIAMAILSKFSALLFLPACGLLTLLCWMFARERATRPHRQEFILRLKSFAIAGLICAALILMCYRFSFHPVTGYGQRPHQFLDHIFGHKGKWHEVAYRVVETTPVPVPEFLHGIEQAGARATLPTGMYLLGQVQSGGWWYFFPVALMVKTPIAFLILVIFGGNTTVRRWRERNRDWRVLAPLASSVALFLICLPTKFNIGLRHILPIYPFLSILAGCGIKELWCGSHTRLLRRVLAGTLATWVLISTTAAHPDYLAYFNELAADHPERILVDSDLDWGQDLLRLRDILQARRVEHFSIAYNGSADLSRMNLPAFNVLASCTPTNGWVAISVLKLQMTHASPGCGGFTWLKDYKPVAVAGKSIRLYWIPSIHGGDAPNVAQRIATGH